MIVYETRRGIECVDVGADYKPITKQKALTMPKYRLMQMLPASTHRLQWIRESNLREKKN